MARTVDDVTLFTNRETRDKTVLDISEDGELLTYNQTRFFVFSQETSGAGLQENDTICTINIPLVVSTTGHCSVRSELLCIVNCLSTVRVQFVKTVISDVDLKSFKIVRYCNIITVEPLIKATPDTRTPL